MAESFLECYGTDLTNAKAASGLPTLFDSQFFKIFGHIAEESVSTIGSELDDTIRFLISAIAG